MRTRALLFLVLMWPAAASAQTPPPVAHNVVRFAAVPPDGTAWARELKAFGREVEAETHGDTRIKIYMGGIAGDEKQMDERIARGQLDGSVGGTMCVRHAPSMRVGRIRGIFRSADEATYVMSRLAPTLDTEFRQAGFVNLGTASLGTEVVLTRSPVRTLDELRKVKAWMWDEDAIGATMMQRMGFNVWIAPVGDAARAFDESRVDGFFAVPAAALAFQWSTRAKYLLDLRLGHFIGCMLMSVRAFDKLPVESQRAIRSASAKLAVRMEELARQQDTALLGGQFQKQGLQVIAAPEDMRTAYLSVARAAREQLSKTLVPEETLQRVLAMLADYRAEHAQGGRR